MFEFVSFSRNVCAIAGAKVARLFSYTSPFLFFFLKYFLMCWSFDIYNMLFLRICDFTVGLFDDLNGFRLFWGQV